MSDSGTEWLQIANLEEEIERMKRDHASALLAASAKAMREGHIAGLEEANEYCGMYAPKLCSVIDDRIAGLRALRTRAERDASK